MAKGQGAERIVLGRVVAPSGKLVVLDPGLVDLWCGSKEPRDADAPDAVEHDYILEGPDAERVGKLLDWSWHPLYLYDLRGTEKREEKLRRVTEEHGLEARLKRLPRRVTHRQRVDLALDRGEGGGEIQYNGLWAAVVGGLPTDRECTVAGTPFTDGPFKGRWRHVDLDVAPRRRVARRAPAGLVMVDHGLLALSDADALADWLAACPHEALLARLKASGELDAATIDVGAAAGCAFGNRWGDVLCPVVRELDAGGGLVRVRLEIGNEKVQEIARQVDARTVQVRSRLALVSRLVTDEGQPIRCMRRETPRDAKDSGWTLLSGEEDDDTESSAFVTVTLSDAIVRWPAIEAHVEADVGTELERPGPWAPFRRADE